MPNQEPSSTAEVGRGSPVTAGPGHGAPRWLANLPIRRKLYLVVAILTINIVVVIALSVFGLGVFSSVRAFVGGEGLWAKAQKNAVYHLARYATLRDERDFATFRQFLAVPLGDRQARLELARPDPDLDAVARAFVAGRNQPDDAPGMARLIHRFGRVGPISRAIEIWSTARS